MSEVKESECIAVLICSTNAFDELHKVHRFFTVISQEPLNIHNRLEILSILGEGITSLGLDFQQLSADTSGFSPNDLQNLHSKAAMASIDRVMKRGYIFPDFHKSLQFKINDSDYSLGLEFSKKQRAELADAPKIPNVKWEDIGGLDHIRDTMIESISLPLSRPELFAPGLKKRAGCLLYGPPGTGKTLVAKAVATTLGINFFSVHFK